MSPLIQTRPGLQVFGPQLRAIRREANIREAELSRRSTVGHQFISEIDLGRENPSRDTSLLLADGLRWDAANFLSTD